ncbi:MAG TPA: 4-alpha-glucanotransferase [Acidimicrobiales bacterium]|nr:4-alpha-glucanotransferase [Acidimicrobiales bacterium]
MTAAALANLADRFGLDTTFVDVTGQPRQASAGAVWQVLCALGADLDPDRVPDDDGAVDDGAVADAVRAEDARRHRLVLEPVVAVRAGHLSSVAVGLPARLHPRDCWLTVQDEAGDARRSRLMPAISRPLGGSAVDGERVDRYEVTIGRDPLPIGYHRVRVDGPGLEATGLVVVAPPCPEPDRAWGAFLPLYALRTDDDWGVGAYPDLARLARWVDGLGGTFVGTLPLYPALPGDTSPYRPATRLGWSERYVDPTALAEAPAAADLLASPGFVGDLARVRQSFYVDYPTTDVLVRDALAPMAEAAFAGPRRGELEAFGRARPELVAYARFRSALAGSEAATGTAGPPARPGLSDAASPDAAPLDREARYHLYAQWAAAQQLQAAAGRLYLDLPVGAHPDGFDPWWFPGSFAAGVDGGAPPDDFFATGQRWGFRPLHPRGIRQDGYAYPIACLRHLMTRAAVVRVDHVMGLHRLYWVPAGREATDGVYVRYHQDEMRAVVCLEAHRAGVSVVGEDLGTVPDGVREAMGQDRMLRSWVFEFEPRATPPELSLATLATHDLPRFGTWLDDRPEVAADLAGSAGTGPTATALAQLAAGPARLVMVDLEDLWGERRPQNRPGTTIGNWENRALRTLDEMADDRSVVAVLEEVDRSRHGQDNQG